MVTITLSIPQEIKDTLSKEQNQSALVTRLLSEHYSKNQDVDSLKKRREALEAEFKRKEAEIAHTIEIIEKQRETEHQEEQLTKENQDERIKNVILTAKEAYNYELSSEQAKEFLEQTDLSDLLSFISKCQGHTTNGDQTKSDTS